MKNKILTNLTKTNHAEAFNYHSIIIQLQTSKQFHASQSSPEQFGGEFPPPRTSSSTRLIHFVVGILVFFFAAGSRAQELAPFRLFTFFCVFCFCFGGFNRFFSCLFFFRGDICCFSVCFFFTRSIMGCSGSCLPTCIIVFLTQIEMINFILKNK